VSTRFHWQLNFRCFRQIAARPPASFIRTSAKTRSREMQSARAWLMEMRIHCVNLLQSPAEKLLSSRKTEAFLRDEEARNLPEQDIKQQLLSWCERATLMFWTSWRHPN
jgi:hypothetical protein